MKMIKMIKLITTFFVATFAFFANANEESIGSKMILKGFGNAGITVSGDLGAIVDNGNQLNIDTKRHNLKGWAIVSQFPKGLFKAGKNYIIRMKICVQETSNKGFVHILVRNGYAGGNDLLVRNVHKCKEREIKLRFAGHEQEGFNFQIHTNSGVKGYIKDLTIFEGYDDSVKFLSIKENQKRYKMDRKTLPTGAKEFDVDQPNNPNGEVVEASKMGIVPGAKDLYKKVQAALDYCKKVNAAKLVFEKNATYYFEGMGNISFHEMKDFIFDGNGSTFIFNRPSGVTFHLYGCERVRMQAFNMDWDEEKNPLASLVEVVKVHNGEKPYVDYKFINYKKHPLYGQYLRAATLSCWDMKEGSVGVENGVTCGYDMFNGRNPRPEYKWISENVYRLYGPRPLMKEGMHFRMQHYYYDGGVANFYYCKHTTLKDINIWASIGHGLLWGGATKYVYMKNVKMVIPKGNPKRCITTTADLMHVAQSQGYFKLEDCDISQGADDCINFHDNSSYGEKRASNSIISRHNYGGNGDTMEFRNADYSPLNFTAKRVSAKKLESGDFEIFFDKDIPVGKEPRYILFNKKFDTHNIIIRNCYFHHNRARGLLVLARDVTIENCRFKRNEMGAIKLETGYTTNIWCEGFGVNNIVIRKNTFEQSNPLGVKTLGYERDIFIGAYLEQDPSEEQTKYPILNNILFEKNIFKDTFGAVATISSAGNVTFWNNTFINDIPRKFPMYYRGSFFIKSAENIRIVNNKFVKSPNVKNIGVYYEKDSVDNLIYQGNKVIGKGSLGF